MYTHVPTHMWKHTHTSTFLTRQPCQGQPGKGPRDYPGPVPTPTPAPPGRGLSASPLPGMGPGVRVPLVCRRWGRRSLLPWSSPQPGRPGGWWDLLPQSSQGPQAPGQAWLPELPPPWPAAPHMVSISSLQDEWCLVRAPQGSPRTGQPGGTALGRQECKGTWGWGA